MRRVASVEKVAPHTKPSPGVHVVVVSGGRGRCGQRSVAHIKNCPTEASFERLPVRFPNILFCYCFEVFSGSRTGSGTGLQSIYISDTVGPRQDSI